MNCPEKHSKTLNETKNELLVKDGQFRFFDHQSNRFVDVPASEWDSAIRNKNYEWVKNRS